MMNRVSKDRLHVVMADGTRTSVPYCSQRLLKDKQQLVEAFYTRDDYTRCTHTSCRQPALWPMITDSIRVSP